MQIFIRVILIISKLQFYGEYFSWLKKLKSAASKISKGRISVTYSTVRSFGTWKSRICLNYYPGIDLQRVENITF